MNCKLCKSNTIVEDTDILCSECVKYTTEAQRAEFERITDDFAWAHSQGFKPDHLVRIFRDASAEQFIGSQLPIVALLNIFIMLSKVCKTTKQYMRASMNFMIVMANVAEPRVFLNHLRVHASQHHKMWHDFLMLAKYSPYLRQTIPECFGVVCCVSPERNQQIAKEYLDGTGPDTSHQSYRQETTIGICSCSHQTMCDTEEECFHHDMPADGNCNILDTDATDRNYRIDDYLLAEDNQSAVDDFAIDFFTTAEKSYQKKFIRELRYNVWIQRTISDETEPVSEFVKPNTQRIILVTDRMRLEKTKQKNSRRSRLNKLIGLPKGSNTGKTKSNRDICLS